MQNSTRHNGNCRPAAFLHRLPNWAVASALVLLCCSTTFAGANQGDPNEPPAEYQPRDFSGAVGVYSISYRATPTEVSAEEPITLTVTITGTGPSKYLPTRAKLHLFPPEMERDFYIQDAEAQDRHVKGLWEDTWEFVYLLRPKSEKVKRIPSLKFAYYDPIRKLYCPQRTTRQIPIKVTQRPQAILKKDATRVLQEPERFYELTTGEAVLARSGHAGDIYPLLLACLVLAPPVICGAWYVVQRRLHPEADWRTRRRRSRAAREALTALQGPVREAIGQRTAFVVAGYLRKRLELSGAEPTPTEVAAHLGRAGISPDVSRRVAEFFRACDAARFAASPPIETVNLTADARALVHALEAELCTSQAC